MVNRPVAEEAARGQARVPRADDDRGYALDDVALRLGLGLRRLRR
jgi:hypothetical protein